MTFEYAIWLCVLWVFWTKFFSFGKLSGIIPLNIYSVPDFIFFLRLPFHICYIVPKQPQVCLFPSFFSLLWSSYSCTSKLSGSFLTCVQSPASSSKADFFSLTVFLTPRIYFGILLKSLSVLSCCPFLHDSPWHTAHDYFNSQLDRSKPTIAESSSHLFGLFLITLG